MTVDRRSTFHGRPNLDWLEQRHRYMVNQSPDRWFGFCTSEGIWLIPRNGLHTDQGSIPRLLTPLIPSDAYWAFLNHDDLYEYGKREVYRCDKSGLPILDRVVDEVPVTREQADRWLLEGMRVENTHGNGNEFESWLVWREVHHFGAFAWNKHHDGRERSRFHLL